MNNDLISRSELKKALCEFMKNNIGIYSNEMFHIVDSMPTVEERPQGKWIFRTDTEWHFECNQCKGLSPWKAQFCGVCGADMRGGAE